MYDVAKLARVSIATVSFTYSQPHRVKESTRNVVLEAASALGYVPSASARGLAAGRTGVLGLFSFDFLPRTADILDATKRLQKTKPDADPNEDFRLFPVYVDEVQRGVEMESLRRGYALMLAGGHPRDGERDVTDVAGRVDGLMVFPQSIPDHLTRHLSARIPVLELSASTSGTGTHHVTVDNESGIRQLVAHLHEVHGYRDMTFIKIPNAETTLRHNAFTAALHELGLPVHPPIESAPRSRGVTTDLLRNMTSKGTLPDVFVCANDEEALHVMDTLKLAGIQVPNQVAVTGFDGVVAGALARPTLTTVRQPMEQMGRTAVDILIHAILNPTEPPRAEQLPVSLVIRQSCGC